MIVTWGRPVDNGGAEIEGYILEKRDKDGIRWTKCHKKRLTDLRFRVTGLTDGHFYEFRVSAENAAGVGESSEPSIFYRACDALYPPGPPSNPKVTDTSRSSVSLAWSKPIYDGGAPIKGYVVEVKEATADEWITCTPPTGLQGKQFTVTKLKENNEYNFRICAINSEGVGESATIPGTVIAADKIEPPEIELDADLRKVVTVRASGTLRLFVTIKGRPEPEVKWEKAEGTISDRAQIEVTSSYTMLVIDNVNRFDSGRYNLTLENNSGKKSAFVNVRVLDSPSAPVNLTIREVKRDSVALAWEPPLIDGGAKITNYIIEKRESTRKAYATVTNNCTKNTFKIDQLQEGCIYYFRVLAANEYGVGLPAETAEPVKVSEPPYPPGKVTLVDVTRNTATITWEKPESDGGSKITSYIVEMQTKGSEKWSTCTQVKTLEATITGLSKGEEYTFRVIAINEKGKSDPRQLGVPVVAKDIEIQPSAELLFNTFSVKAGDDLKIDVPIRGRPPPTASWRKDGQTLKETTRVNVQTSKTSTLLTIKEASKEDVGNYELCISNSAGSTTFSITIIVLDRPGPPCDVHIDSVSADNVTLSWKPPVYDGGCHISNYIVEKRETTTTIWDVVSAAVARTSIKVARLTTGSEYQFRVYAENRYGRSTYIESPSVVAEYPFKPPGPPGTPQVVHATKTFMTVSWQEPVNDGGSKTSRIAWTLCEGELRTTSCKVTKLLRGNEYIFRVMGVNKYGVGEALESYAVKALDPFTVPNPPKSLEITSVTKDSMTLCWARPDSDGGNEISGYIIERREKNSLRWIRVNKKPVYDLRVKSLGLREGCEYEYRVYAENAAGLSLPSDTSPLIRAEDPVFIPSPPSKPKILDSTRSNITIGWTKPLFDGGAPVTGYTVEYKKTDETDWSIAIQNLRGTEYSVIGLTSGSEYVFRVRSINKVGASDPSDVSEPQVAKEREEEPAFDIDSEMRKTLIVKAGDSFTMTVPFRGKPVPNVMWNKPETDLRTRASIDSSDYCTSLTIEKATRNDSGKYALTLQNVLSTATLTLVVKVLDSPGPPSNIAVKDVTKESAVLSWDVPENDGGAPVKNYYIEKREASKKAWVTITNNCHRLSYKVTSLQEGAVYYFRVSGENEFEQLGMFADTETQDEIVGSNLKVEIPISGKPLPKTTLSRDGVPLKATMRFNTETTAEISQQIMLVLLLIINAIVFSYCRTPKKCSCHRYFQDVCQSFLDKTIL
uniref:Titin n=1 Tax=Gopherus evgoodei TaxID=1825980 RepID=A0A8C4YKD5_9SAUR